MRPELCRTKKPVGEKGRTLRLSWLEADDVEVDLIDMVDIESTFGRPSPNVAGDAVAKPVI
jgi:hypothetical protein